MKRYAYIFLSMALAFPLMGLTARPMWNGVQKVVAGQHAAPFQYRLHYHVTHALGALLDPSLAVYLLWFVTLAAFALLVDEYARRWHAADRAQLWTLAGLLLVIPAVSFHTGSAWASLMEAVFVAATLLLLDRDRDGWLPLVVVPAVASRETGIFVVLLVWLVRRRWGQAIVLGLVAVAVHGAVRYHYGPVPAVITLAEAWQTNLRTLPLFLFGLLFFGWLFWAAWQGYRRAPEPLRRAGWLVPAYLAAVMVGGVWYEWRLIFPMLPILLPLAMGGTNAD